MSLHSLLVRVAGANRIITLSFYKHFSLLISLTGKMQYLKKKKVFLQRNERVLWRVLRSGVPIACLRSLGYQLQKLCVFIYFNEDDDHAGLAMSMNL